LDSGGWFFMAHWCDFRSIVSRVCGNLVRCGPLINCHDQGK